MRIAFMGATELGWQCCQALFELEQEVVGIFSIPRQFRISWSTKPVDNATFRTFEDLAEEYSVPLAYVEKRMGEHIGWYYMIPRSLRELAPLGAVGIHASLLPRFRGGAPLVWAIIEGERETGVSLFHFTDGVDDGDIIAQKAFPIAFEEDIAAVVERATDASVELIRHYIPLLDQNRTTPWPQDQTRATNYPQRRPEDGVIDWKTKSALQVYNWVRAQTRPYPGAFAYLGDEKITIWKVEVADPAVYNGAVPGEMVVNSGDLLVGCADTSFVFVREVSLEQGETMDGTEFARRRLVNGNRLCSERQSI